MNKFFKKAIHFKGKHFYGSILPKEIPRGEIGDCFDHCLAIAKTFSKYKYVEGLALVNKKWIYHAWLTEEGQEQLALDPTWYAVNKQGERVPLEMIQYIGVKMDTELVMEFVLKTGYKAVLKNYYRDKELAQKIYDVGMK